MGVGVVSTDIAARLGDGCSLVVGLVTPEGRPVAARATAFDPVDEGRRAVLFVPSHEVASLDLPVGDDLDLAIAVTGADVRTLESAQLKGRVRRVTAGTEADLERARRSFVAFSDAVLETDGFEAEVMARWMPSAVVVLEIEVDEVYDQTPGPGAGRLLARSEP